VHLAGRAENGWRERGLNTASLFELDLGRAIAELLGMSASLGKADQHEHYLTRTAVGDYAGRSAPSQPRGARGRGSGT